MEKTKGRGAILLDKPGDLTSMQCVERVKKILRADRAGHSGTLDPKVTGVMLIALNEARKAMTVLIGLRKEYEGKMHIHGDVDKEKIKKVARDFVGKITQIPPVRSAVVRKPREREVYSFEITKIKGRDLHFRVGCESGTYVRKLCHDFGERLGVGAHMTELRRTKINGFSENECTTIEKLGKKDVIPLERILERIGLKKVIVKRDSVGRIRNGIPVKENDIIKTDRLTENERVGIYCRSEIIALGLVRDNKEPVIKTDRVFK
jgi:H/ACA ribonucleoprotein complex subunit 4